MFRHLYDVLLRAFPRDFRERFGADMRDVFADRSRAARDAGMWATVRHVNSTVADTVTHGWGERRQRLTGKGPRTMWRVFESDLLAGVKRLRRNPGFTLAAALMLAIGLGFNTALFAVVNAVLLHPLPYAAPDRIAMIWTGRNPDGTGGVNSYADFSDLKARSRSFDALACYNISFATLTNAGDPEEINGAVVSPEFFAVLGARVLLGRVIESGDELVRDGRPIVIAHSLWERKFSRDPDVVGKTLTLADRPRRIVGVLAPEFEQPEPFWDHAAEFWSPLTVSDEMRTQRGFHYLRVIGRLKRDVTIAQARGEVDAVGRSLIAAFPLTNKESFVVALLRDELMGDVRPRLAIFIGAVALVLTLAMANIVNLLLARANDRRDELTMRAALGASAGRLFSHVIAEGMVLGIFSGLLGLAVAQVGVRLLMTYGQIDAPGIEDTALTGRVIVFSIVLSTITGVLCGLLPALRVARARLTALGSARTTSGLEVSRQRSWLVAAEMALAMPLLIGAALLVQTLVRMQQVDPGFQPERLLSFRITLGSTRYESSEARMAFHDDLRRRLLATPGVSGAGIVSSLPLGGLNNTGGGIVYERTAGEGPADLGVGIRAVGGGYFQAMGIPVLKGRTFADSTADRGTVIVNERAARLMWGDDNPIGRRIRMGNVGDTGKNPWMTVIGVAGNLRHEAITREPSAEIFQPYVDNTWQTMTVVLRTERDPAALVETVRRIMRDADPQIAVVALNPVRAYIDGQLARPRFGVLCAVVLGAVALTLAAFGTFAVLSLLVAQRTKEIGIRVALGAAPRQVQRMVLRDSLVPAAIGCAAGATAAAWLTRALVDQLFEVSALDPMTFIAAPLSLIAVAAVASWWPARRAMRVNPTQAL
ncbi:MAG TPA: ABC transporter permease, partial [Vicinamibacterales bacterium]|nr:ABC transporter permease [Vicinamibacterales bacterium]